MAYSKPPAIAGDENCLWAFWCFGNLFPKPTMIRRNMFREFIPETPERKCLDIGLSEFIADAESAAWIAPFDVEIWAPDFAGAAFEAIFKCDQELVIFPLVCFGGAEDGARFAFAIGAYQWVFLHQVALFIRLCSYSV